MSLSDELTIAGIAASILTTAASILWAVYERKQSQNARQQAKHFRQLLLKQQIAQQFTECPQRAKLLFRYLRSRRWDRAAEVALGLSADLASLNGARLLLGTSIENELNAALEVMGTINRLIPRSGATLELETESKLIESSNLMVITVNAVERTLRIKAALGGDEDGD